jgi:hypothetical protein
MFISIDTPTQYRLNYKPLATRTLEIREEILSNRARFPRRGFGSAFMLYDYGTEDPWKYRGNF